MDEGSEDMRIRRETGPFSRIRAGGDDCYGVRRDSVARIGSPRTAHPHLAIRTQTIGERVRRREDPRLVTGQALYTPDIALPGALHLAVVRSPYPHAEIVSIETEEAAAAPGVAGVFTGADILPTLKRPFPVAKATDGGAFTELHIPARWALADKKALTVGDPVVAVVAETAAQGRRRRRAG